MYVYISNQINHKYRSSSSLRQIWVPPNSPELCFPWNMGRCPGFAPSSLDFCPSCLLTSCVSKKIQPFCWLPHCGPALFQIHLLEPIPASYLRICPSQNNFLCSVAQTSPDLSSSYIFWPDL